MFHARIFQINRSLFQTSIKHYIDYCGLASLVAHFSLNSDEQQPDQLLSTDDIVRKIAEINVRSPAQRKEALYDLVILPPRQLIQIIMEYVQTQSKMSQVDKIKEVAPLVEKLLNTKLDKNERISAAVALRVAGCSDSNVIDALIKGTRDSMKDVRVESILALGELKTITEPVLEALLFAFKDEDFTIWPIALIAL